MILKLGLNSIDLMRPGADTELKNLLEEVERERRLWSDEPSELPDKPFELPECLKRYSGTESLLSPAERWLSRMHQLESTEGRPLSSLERILKQKTEKLELAAKQYMERMAIERSLKASALGLIVSSLGLLISTRNLYESTRSRL